jgi:NAD(P)-dependent dehydrogenase (short-subunit alcohol dehydrogenase family)
VTGGSAGIGFGITAHLLQHNANSITILSNKEEHANSALEELKEYGDTNRVHWTKCDLEDLKLVDEVANKLAQSQKKIDGVRLKPLSVCRFGMCSFPFSSRKTSTINH